MCLKVRYPWILGYSWLPKLFEQNTEIKVNKTKCYICEKVADLVQSIYFLP